MLKQLYIHNFRCFQNFTFTLEHLNSAFLLGKNGSGKSTIFNVMEIFQKIGHGTSSLEHLISKEDFTFGHIELPMEFKLEVIIKQKLYIYSIVLEFPDNFHVPKIKRENLIVDNKEIMSREEGQTSHNSTHFSLDWHHVGIPLINTRNDNEPLGIFKQWLKNIVVLQPIPTKFEHISKTENSQIDKQGIRLASWTRWLIPTRPASYGEMTTFLQDRIPDFDSFKFEDIGSEHRKLLFTFKEKKNLDLPFHLLSDGEKIFFLAATILIAQKNNPNMFCCWDEPSNYVGLHEVRQLIITLRKAFDKSNAQILMTSHSQEVFNSFSEENIFVLNRDSHLMPAKISLLKELKYNSKILFDAYMNGEVG